MRYLIVVMLLITTLLCGCKDGIIENDCKVTTIEQSSIADKKYKITLTTSLTDGFGDKIVDNVYYYTNDDSIKVGDKLKIVRFE